MPSSGASAINFFSVSFTDRGAGFDRLAIPPPRPTICLTRSLEIRKSSAIDGCGSPASCRRRISASLPGADGRTNLSLESVFAVSDGLSPAYSSYVISRSYSSFSTHPPLKSVWYPSNHLADSLSQAIWASAILLERRAITAPLALLWHQRQTARALPRCRLFRRNVFRGSSW